MVFYRPNHGEFELDDVTTILNDLFDRCTDELFDLAVATDSQRKDGYFSFVNVITVHRVTQGGVFLFWRKQRESEFGVARKNPNAIRDRLLLEAEQSRKLAGTIDGDVMDRSRRNHVDFAVHVDVNGDQSSIDASIARQAIGHIRGCGYPVRDKPDAYAASKAADRICRNPGAFRPAGT